MKGCQGGFLPQVRTVPYNKDFTVSNSFDESYV